MADFEPILSKYCIAKDTEARKLSHYEKRDGYKAARKCLTEMKPEDIIEVVKASGLRGRGGAGFPTGMKWGFVPKNSDKPKYVVVNADESEPGTFKDRILMQWDPHTTIDGAICCAASIGAEDIYVYIRGEFVEQARTFQAAIDEAYEAGYLGENVFGIKGRTIHMTVHRGAGAYICGEETGMLSSLEGGRGYPKLKPPFPAVEGLFRCPTIVNNVETLATVPFIINNGAEWHRQWGTEKSPGFKVFSLSGHVERPGNYEVPLGTSLKEFIESPKYGGGVWKGRKLKCVIPGGSSAPPLTPAEVETTNLCYESCAEHGTMLGSGAIIVLDDHTSMVDACRNIMAFYHHESCGQCTPCREGTGWLEKMFIRFAEGGGTPEDLETLNEVGWNMRGNTICALADAAAMPAHGFLERFRDELLDHMQNGIPEELLEGTRGSMDPAKEVASIW